MLLIDVDPEDESTQACDLRVRGSEPEAEVIGKIAASAMTWASAWAQTEAVWERLVACSPWVMRPLVAELL